MKSLVCLLFIVAVPLLGAEESTAPIRSDLHFYGRYVVGGTSLDEHSNYYMGLGLGFRAHRQEYRGWDFSGSFLLGFTASTFEVAALVKGMRLFYFSEKTQCIPYLGLGIGCGIIEADSGGILGEGAVGLEWGSWKTQRRRQGGRTFPCLAFLELAVHQPVIIPGSKYAPLLTLELGFGF